MELLSYQYTNAMDFDFIDYTDTLLPLPKKQLVIRYESSATLFLVLDRPISGQLYLIDHENTANSISIGGDQNLYIVEDLMTDRLYELAIENGEEHTSIGLVSTFSKASQTSWIDMYPSLYNIVSEWVTSTGDASVGLFDYLYAQDELHSLEKTWFLQQFYGYGYPLTDDLKGMVPERSDFDERGLTPTVSSECLCRPLRLTFQHSIRPEAEGIQTTSKDGVYENTWGTPPSQSFSRAGKRWVAWGMKGPAKYMQAWQESPRCTRGDNYATEMSFDESQLNGPGNNFADATGGNQSFVRMTWACVGFDDLIPESCLCERNPRVRVCYTYSGEAMAEAETLGGGVCRGGRSSLAFAEDMAFMAYNSDADNRDNAEVIESGTMRAGVSCGRSADWSGFIASVVKAGFYASKVFAKAKSGISILTSIYYGLKLADEIEKAANGPKQEYSGSCGKRTAVGPGLINGCFTRTLNQNSEAVALLQSNGTIRVEGKGRHRASGRILSSFGLTVTMQRSDPDQIGPICCRTGNGVYSLAHTPGNPWSGLSALQSWARNNFFADGLDQVDNINNLDGEYGYRDGGGINEECALQIENITPHDRSSEGQGDSQYSDIRFNGQSFGIVNTTDNRKELTIFNAAGQLVFNQIVSAGEDYTIDMPSTSWPSGIYMYQLKDGKVVESGKIFKY